MNVHHGDMPAEVLAGEDLAQDDRQMMEALLRRHSMVLWDDALREAAYGRCARCLDARGRADLDILFDRDDGGSIHAAAWLDTAGGQEMHLSLLADGTKEALRLVPLLSRAREMAASRGATQVTTCIGLEVPHVLDALRAAGFSVAALMNCGGSAEVWLAIAPA